MTSGLIGKTFAWLNWCLLTSLGWSFDPVWFTKTHHHDMLSRTYKRQYELAVLFEFSVSDICYFPICSESTLTHINTRVWTYGINHLDIRNVLSRRFLRGGRHCWLRSPLLLSFLCHPHQIHPPSAVSIPDLLLLLIMSPPVHYIVDVEKLRPFRNVVLLLTFQVDVIGMLPSELNRVRNELVEKLNFLNWRKGSQSVWRCIYSSRWRSLRINVVGVVRTASPIRVGKIITLQLCKTRILWCWNVYCENFLTQF